MTTRLAIADALVAELQTILSDVSGLVVERRIAPNYAAKDLVATHIVIVPGDRDDAIETQATNAGIKTVQVGIMRALPAAQNDSPDGVQGDALDALCNLVDRVCDLWGEDGALREKSIEGADWTALELTVPINAPLLTDHRIFQSVFQLTYQE